MFLFCLYELGYRLFLFKFEFRFLRIFFRSSVNCDRKKCSETSLLLQKSEFSFLEWEISNFTKQNALMYVISEIKKNQEQVHDSFIFNFSEVNYISKSISLINFYELHEKENKLMCFFQLSFILLCIVLNTFNWWLNRWLFLV